MKTEKLFNTLYLIALIPFVVIMINAANHRVSSIDEHRAELSLKLAHQAAKIVERLYDDVQSLTEYCANSPFLLKELNLQLFSETCGNSAALMDSWVFVIEIGSVHRQIFNSRLDAPSQLPTYSREDEYPTLIELEAASKQDGKPHLSDSFNGLIYKKPMVTSGQFVRLENKREAMVYVGFSMDRVANALSEIIASSDVAVVVLDGERKIAAQTAPFDNEDFSKAINILASAFAGSDHEVYLDFNLNEYTNLVADIALQKVHGASKWMIAAILYNNLSSYSGSVFSDIFQEIFLGFFISMASILCIAFVKKLRSQVDATEAQLAVANEQRQKVSRLLSTFAHDVRSPLINLLGSLELLKRKVSSKNDDLSRAQASGEALLQLIDDILELSFLGSGDISLNPTTIDLRQFSNELIIEHKGQAERKGILISNRLGEKCPDFVEVDRLRLKQVCSNLISNAIKYTDRGSVLFSIDGIVERGCDARLIFSVIDTGIGLSDDELPIVLREFGRLENLSTKNAGGVGLGLAISQRILDMMGSKLEIDSVKGVGSTFMFQIKARSSIKRILKGFEGKPLAGTTILYAEDEQVIREITVNRLVDLGAKVFASASGDEVMLSLDSITPDLILLDLEMPGLSGFDVIRRIRNQKKDSHFPIFVLTSHISGGKIDEARACGADSVFTKPLQVHALAAALYARRGDQGTHTPKLGGSNYYESYPIIDDSHINDLQSENNGHLLHKVIDSLEEIILHFHNFEDTDSAEELRQRIHRAVGICQVIGAVKLERQLRLIDGLDDHNLARNLNSELPELFWVLKLTISKLREIVPNSHS